MSRLSVRVALMAVCLVAWAGVGVLIWTCDQQARELDAGAAAFSRAARVAGIGVSELRAAQQAYVAVGQGPDFWFARASAIDKSVHDALASMRSAASSAQASVALDDAAGALQDFDQMDQRAREYARGRQLTSASDLIFADGFDLTKKTADAIDRALGDELAERSGVLSFVKRREAYALSGGVLLLALALALLVPVRRPAAIQAAPASRSVAPESAPVPREAPAESAFGLDSRPGAPARAPAPDPLQLPQVAALCADLAKITDTHALTALLGRAADILNAAGIVVWIADPDGRELSPIVVHGYPAHLATRLGTIARDASNVTAAAYRTGLLRTVTGDAVSNGAIAAPLVSAMGCVGVVAAEMKDGGEQREALLAAATIIASQLATLVGPPSVRAARSEAAG